MQLTIATRGSELALAQARSVAAALERGGCLCRLEIITTCGDRNLNDPLPNIGGKGLFTREVDEAVLDGRAQIAVHSLKDLPVEDEKGLILAAVPERGSDRDVLVLNMNLTGVAGWKQEVAAALAKQNTPQEGAASTASILRLLREKGATIGCGAPRRRVQLFEAVPELPVSGVRGNIATRLRRMEENNWGGVVMAEAALQRLGLADTLPYLVLAILPAAGQGALGLRARADDDAVRQVLTGISHPASFQRALAERSFLQAVGGGCHVPAGIRTLLVRERLFLQAVLYTGASEARCIPVRAEAEACAEGAAEAGRRLGGELAQRAGITEERSE